MSCINKSHPDYKELKGYFGESLANSLIRANKMIIPSIPDGIRMIQGSKVLQFKKALNYLRSTTSASVEDLLAAMPRIIQRKGNTVYVTKGVRLSERPTAGAKITVEDANVAFLNNVNKEFGSIFTLEKDYGLTNSQVTDIQAFAKELLEADLVPGGYIEMVTQQPVEFFKFVAQQGQNLNTEGKPNTNFDSTQPTIDSFGQSVVDFAVEMFPYDRIDKPEMLAKLKPLETASANKKFPSPVEFVESVLPAKYVEKYKDLYETAAKLYVPMNVERGSVGYGAVASFHLGTVNIDPALMKQYHTKWGDFVETVNHELIHGILRRSWGDNFQMHSKLKPLFDKVVENFDKASPEVQFIISTIIDSTKEYPVENTDAIDDNYKDGDKLPTTDDMEEFITYGLSNMAFAKFLDDIPYGEVEGQSKSVWQKLKEIIKDFFASITSGSVLDNLTKILEDHLRIDKTIEGYKRNLGDNGGRVTIKSGNKLFSEPNPETAVIAEQYATDKGFDYTTGEKIYALDEAYSKKIADAYEAMQHNPSDPEVKASYDALAKETKDQFEAIQKAGYNVEIFTGEGEPYASSGDMIKDLVDNKHMFIFATESGFGTEGSQNEDNALLADSGFKDINGKPLVVNDLFRFVHDFFGHSERGNGFGAIGEENAWDVHVRMYSPLARRAMTSETRGQNSWVNFGPQMRNADGSLKKKGDPGYLSPKERAFAEQKTGLLPEEFSQLPEDIGLERPGSKIAEGTYKVVIDEAKLSELVEENKKNPTEVPYEESIPDEQFQKSSDSEMFWEFEQRKRYTLDNLVRMLSKRFNIPFEFDRTMDVAAKFSKGKIYLNPDKIGLDSPFHEIAHPFVEMLKSENPDLYNSLINELKNSEEGQAEIERVAKEYPELSPQEQLDEALVSLIGKNAGAAFMESAEQSTKKNLLQRFWDWVKEKLFGMGLNASDLKPNSTIMDISFMISNPMFSIDLSRTVDLQQKDEYFQKKSSQQMQRDFNSLIDETIAKLHADVNIAGKTATEKTRKFFSAKQAEELRANRKDINALNNFITSGLFNLKDVNDRFDEFIKKYEAKGTKSKDDLRDLSLLLNEIEDNVTLYSSAGPLLESVFQMFPAEKDNIADWGYSLKREKRLLTEYQSWGVNVIADWLFPYQKKAIRKALATNNLYSVVSKEVYDNEVQLAKDEGITDKALILERAVKQEIRNTLLVAKRDASGITGYLAGVLNSRDSIASTVGQAIMDELHRALTYGHAIEKRFKGLMKQYRGSTVFSSNKDEKEFYSKFLRQAKVWTYKGLGKDGKPEYEYINRTAFHEEYEWDTFYNKKREDFEAILKKFGGKVPSKVDLAKYKSYISERDAWFASNTVVTKVNGKDARIPAAQYKNATFAALQNDPLFKDMYQTYKASNDKLGGQGLKYGIVPQVKNSTVRLDTFKPKNALEGIRHWIGEQEQVYFVQSIAGGEKPVVPISHVKLLDEADLSYNLIDSVSKFATSSEKYNAMKMIEPQVQILKNFIGGNNALNIKKRRTVQRSATGIKALSKLVHDDMYVESTKLNNQLNSFLNDAVYGQSMKKDVIQMWDAKFEVWKTADKSNNGGPQVQKVHGFENVRELTGLTELDYSGFKFAENREVGEWTIKMTKKDWNFSVKKGADRLGLLTALQTMVVNPISATVNVIRGKTESFVEAMGGRYFNLKDYAFADAEYWKTVGSGDFFEDLKGGKPSYVSSMLVEYDALQGELMDAEGRKLERGLVNKFFRTRRLFFMQNGGEHYIQAQLMIAMMNHQKVKLNAGGTISLYEARKREFDGTLKMSDTNWTEESNREFRETLAEVNTRLNGNYNKTDKAMIQRTWWGSALMMFRKHIYNGLANRYRKGYVNYQTGDYTEGYWRTFANGLVREIGDIIRDRQITKFSLNEQEKYAFKKFGGDLAAIALFITMFKMFDDDDEDNEFNDSMALIFRRLVSESGQYTPIIAPLEAGKMVKNPSAITYTVNNFYEAIKQTIADPTEEYERTGPGYQEGDNKAWKKWQRAIPGWRIVLNTQEPERLLQFYQQNSLGFLRPSAGKEEEEDNE